MNSNDLAQAVQLEAEQSVPVPITDLYLDYEIVEETAAKAGSHIDVKLVAAPRAIVDSYIKLFDLLGLEIAGLETSLNAVSRAMISAGQADQTTLLIDFGSVSVDLCIIKQTIRLTGTVAIGGEFITQTLANTLKITLDQATEIKYKFGIGPSGLQAKVVEALAPQLTTLIREIKQILKYYTDRSETKDQVQGVILSGGSASMPGLVDYLTKALGLPIEIGDPWAGLATDSLPAVSRLEAPIYTTAIGAALQETLP